MTLKTSLFNKGIYKSTVKRYMWGSVLYFIILFMTTVLPTLLMSEPYYPYVENGSSLLYDGFHYMVFPILTAMCVPTVVGMLVFRFVHSKKASVFTHSLPVSRTSVYTSTLAGAFTLMSAPVILNGLVFLIMALTAYSGVITVSSCFVWIGLNLMCLFMMFACTAFVAMLTGNTFAMAGLNVLFHTILIIAVACFGFIAEQFLFGYVYDNAVMNNIAEGNFPVWIMLTAGDIYSDNAETISLVRLAVNLVISAGLYVLGWLLYKKRSLETAEDVAGFKILNPLFKYLLTFLGATVSFALFSEFITEKISVFITIVALISAVVYFASEMILKKTVRIWKGSYKGFIGFAVVYTLLIFVFAFTSFFGYETYVPKAEDVKYVSVQWGDYWEDGNFVDDEAVIKEVVKWHSDCVSNIPQSVHSYVNVDITYIMNNGKEISRSYFIPEESRTDRLKSKLYKYDSYKTANEKIFMKNYEVEDGKIVEKDLYLHYMDLGTESDSVVLNWDDTLALAECLRNDISNLSYEEIHGFSDNRSYHVYVQYGDNPYFEVAENIGSMSFYVDERFETSWKWIEENINRLSLQGAALMNNE